MIGRINYGKSEKNGKLKSTWEVKVFFRKSFSFHYDRHLAFNASYAQVAMESFIDHCVAGTVKIPLRLKCKYKWVNMKT